MWWLLCRRFGYRRKCNHDAMTFFLHARLPTIQSDCVAVNWLAVDIETTSLDPLCGEIASIGWVPVENATIRLERAEHYYIRTENTVGQSAIYHHIRDMDLLNAVSIESAIECLLQAAAGRVLVFHNAQLDMAFLNQICKRLFNTPFLVPIVDTLLLEQRRLRRSQQQLEGGNLRLHMCRHRYGLPDYPAHNALIDALATAELFMAWLSHYDDQGRVKLSDCMLFDF